MVFVAIACAIILLGLVTLLLAQKGSNPKTLKAIYALDIIVGLIILILAIYMP